MSEVNLSKIASALAIEEARKSSIQLLQRILPNYAGEIDQARRRALVTVPKHHWFAYIVTACMVVGVCVAFFKLNVASTIVISAVYSAVVGWSMFREEAKRKSRFNTLSPSLKDLARAMREFDDKTEFTQDDLSQLIGVLPSPDRQRVFKELGDIWSSSLRLWHALDLYCTLHAELKWPVADIPTRGDVRIRL